MIIYTTNSLSMADVFLYTSNNYLNTSYTILHLLIQINGCQFFRETEDTFIEVLNSIYKVVWKKNKSKSVNTFSTQHNREVTVLPPLL